MTVWVEVGDLIDFASRHRRPSGIQRVGFEIALALARTVHAPGCIGFCSTAEGDDQGPAVVSHADVSTTYAALRSGSPAGVGEARERAANLQGGRKLAARLVSGDVLLTLSPPLGSWDFATKVRNLAEGGVSVAVFMHDIVPILHPRWCEERVTSQFERWHRALLPYADTVLTSSRAVAADLAEWATKASIRLRRSAAVVRLGSRFAPVCGGPTLELPRGVDLAPDPGFALFVSTVEPRKNHALAIEVWRRAIAALGPTKVPQLVCVGRVGWLVDDLLRHLSDTSHLGGKVVLLEGVSDRQLAQLYSSCKFTLFPSHYEGWGLPVTESLAFGKVCLASKGGAIPEAGGPHCIYFEPGSEDEAEAVLRAVLESPSLLRRLTAAVREGFEEVSWDATAREVLAAVNVPERRSVGG